MIHKAKDLSAEQKMAIESLLGRTIAEDEAISIRTLATASAPESRKVKRLLESEATAGCARMPSRKPANGPTR